MPVPSREFLLFTVIVLAVAIGSAKAQRVPGIPGAGGPTGGLGGGFPSGSASSPGIGGIGGTPGPFSPRTPPPGLWPTVPVTIPGALPTASSAGLPRPGTSPARPVVPKTKGLGEHRGQGDASASPVIQAIVKTESRGIDGRLTPAWGSTSAATACNASLVALKASGRVAVFKEPRDSEETQQELAFLRNCLGPVDTRLEDRVGRLVRNGEVLCTVLLLAPTLALTARHCLFDKERSVGARSSTVLVARTADIRSTYVEVGPISQPRRAGIASINLFGQFGLEVKVQVDTRFLSTFEPQTLPSSKTEQFDVISLVLSKLVTDGAFEQIEVTEPKFGDRIYLPAFHEPTRLQGLPDESGLRQQVAGTCQVLQPSVDGCMTHLCSTTPGSSGAPILVERVVGGRPKLYLVAVHTSGLREATACQANPAVDGVVNYGVRVSTSDLARLNN